MKLNLLPKSPRADTFYPALGETAKVTLQPAFTPKAGLYHTVEEAARRKQALLTRMNDRQRQAKVALIARRGLLRQGAAPPG